MKKSVQTKFVNMATLLRRILEAATRVTCKPSEVI
jgi:hypothetical protein